MTYLAGFFPCIPNRLLLRVGACSGYRGMNSGVELAASMHLCRALDDRLSIQFHAVPLP